MKRITVTIPREIYIRAKTKSVYEGKKFRTIIGDMLKSWVEKGIPEIRKYNGNKIHFNTAIDDELLKEAKKKAVDEDVSMSDVIGTLLDEWAK